jgi:hypothetical protein
MQGGTLRLVPRRSRRYRAFLAVFVGVAMTAATAILALTVIVDPFGLNELVQIDGFNTAKPHMFSNARLVKAYYIRRIKPRGLILGSSRADVGLNADHAGWPAAARPVFNASFPSARIEEIYYYLRYAHSQSGLTRIVIGLDFFAFDERIQVEPGFDVARLEPDALGPWRMATIKDQFTAFFSYDAISAAVSTLRSQDQYAVGYLPNGGQDPGRREQNIFQKGGHYAAFLAALRETVTSRDGVAMLAYGPSDETRNAELGRFLELLRFCQREGIDAYLLISPVHALWLESIWELGAWPDYERWKRDLVRIVDRVTREAADAPVIELWDFSGFNAITTERVPPRDAPDARMQWYWEASHYKVVTGDLMLTRVFGKGGPDPAQFAPTFGIRLTPENIDAHLQAIRSDRTQYVASRPEEVRLLQMVLDDVPASVLRR